MSEKYKRICQQCKKAYFINPHYGVNYPGKYCDRTCYFKARKGVRVSPNTEMKKGYKKEKSISWKGGKTITKHGYVQVHKPEHPNSNQRGYIFEHRVIMEKHIGRYLELNEVVHHIDHNPSNNEIDNLMLFGNNSEHIKYEVDNGERIYTNKGVIIA